MSRLPSWLSIPLQYRHYKKLIANATPDSEPDLRFAVTLLHEGDSAIDIGANVGLWTRFISQAVGATGSVTAIEPIPRNFALLKHTIRSFGLENTNPVQMALTDQDGYVEMSIPYFNGRIDFYQAHIEATGRPLPSFRKIRVPGCTLDSLATGLSKRVHLIKCDTEGHEEAVLRGAETILRRDQPCLIVEINSNPDIPGSSANRLIEYLKGIGYEHYRWDGQILKKRKHNEVEENHIFLVPEMALRTGLLAS